MTLKGRGLFPHTMVPIWYMNPKPFEGSFRPKGMELAQHFMRSVHIAAAWF